MFHFIDTRKSTLMLLALLFGLGFCLYKCNHSKFSNQEEDRTYVVAVANYGPHSSLQNSIDGMKDKLRELGYVSKEDTTTVNATNSEAHIAGDKIVEYIIMDVGFNFSMISQMIKKLKSYDPDVIVAITTPVALSVKSLIKDTPIVFHMITDPVHAGLIREKYNPEGNITGTSDMQDISLVLNMAKQILPKSKRVGILHSIAEPNDQSLVSALKSEAAKLSIDVVAVPFEQSRDIPDRMKEFENNVDFIYVGVGGAVQPFLEVITAKAMKMNIPVFNADSHAVKKGLVLGSYGVNSYAIGLNVGVIVDKILSGVDIHEISPIYPAQLDHKAYINKNQAKYFNLVIPENSENISIVESKLE